MSENTVTKKEYHCKNCGTALKEDGVSILYESGVECPKCGLKRLKDLSQYYALATGEAKDLLESFDRERKCDNTAKINKLLKEADSWRYNKDYTEEYVKDIVDVLHFNDDGDIEIKKVAKIGTETKTRKADEAKVYEFTKNAAELGSLAAITSMGKWLLGGYVCKRQTINAIALLCRAAMCGSREAYRILIQGDEFYADDFVHRMPMDILRRSGYDDYYVNNLTNVKFWEKRENPIGELERFSASNMLWAKYVLGEMYLRGNAFVQKDLKKGVALILSAADDGPYNVQRAIKAKALLQFDKLMDLQGQNNVDKAIETHWRIQNLRVRREAQAEILARTSVLDCKDGRPELLTDTRGAQLVWRAIKHYKDAYGASWITLPDNEDVCKKLSKGMFDGCDWKYYGSRNRVKKDGKIYYYRSPFIGKDGFTGTHGLCFDCRTGLTGNLREKGAPTNTYGFEYGNKYNFHVGDFEYSALEDVDVLWLFRQPEFCRDKDTNKDYVFWGHNTGKPVDFKPAGFSEADLLLLIDFVRRYVLSDLRKGVKLSDGSIQKGQFSSKIDIPLEPSKYTSSFLEKLDAKGSTEKTKVDKKESSKKVPSHVSDSSKKRWKFILVGLLFGVFGLHFLYARRKGWFFLYWLMIIANVAQTKVPAMADVIGKTPYFGIVAGLMLVGSIFFMKKDGDGNRM